MSTDLPIAIDGWDLVHESLDEFRAVGEDSRCFFAEWSAEVGSLLRELLRERQQWAGQQRRLETELDKQTLAKDRFEAEMKTLREDRDALSHERSLLEAELENVRRRAAQLADSLDEQRRTATEQELYWRGEFHRQCDLVERLTGQWTQALAVGPVAPADRSAAAPQVGAATVATPGQHGGNEKEAGNQNSALESVRAQFELLQKEATQRRKENVDSV